MNNSSFPRGYLLHDDNGMQRRLHFVPWRDRRHPVFAYPAYSEEKLLELKKSVTAMNLDAREGQILQDVLEAHFAPNTLSQNFYSDQISHVNYDLWKRVPGMEQVELMYLQQEDIVIDVLLGHHLPLQTQVAQLMTDRTHLEAFEETFDGITGAFTGRQKGTFLFWHLKNGNRERLHRNGKQLENSDGSYVLTLTIAGLTEALKKREIFPSMALTFIVCSFYHGLTCFGGFSQVTYLGQMKHAYNRLLEQLAEPEHQEKSANPYTDILCGDLLFAVLLKGDHRIPATTIDLIIRSNVRTAEILNELVHTCTLEDALDQMMPELHKIYYGTATEAPPFPYSTL